LKAVAHASELLLDDEVDRTGLVADLAKPRAQKTRRALAEAGEALGVLLQNVWAIFDPRAIVLGGEAVTIGGKHFLEAATARLDVFGSRWNSWL
jgi:predicted NBD/HSP70 family sugar kinase